MGSVMVRGLTALAASSSAAGTPPLLGMAGPQGSLGLVRLDPAELRALPGASVPVGDGGCAARLGGTLCWPLPAWAFSPDRRKLAVAAEGAELRIVDVARLRVIRRLPIEEGGPVGALAWLGPQRLLAVQDEDYWSERQRLLVIDLARNRVTAVRALGGSVLGAALAGKRLVLVVAPAQAIGPARLLVADARADVRGVDLGLAAGERAGSGRFEEELPGLAVDAAGGHAFVVGQDGVLEVDVRRLAVSRHPLHPAGRVLSARAKVVAGWRRQARWVGGDLLAVSGWDTGPGGTKPAGLAVIDTRTWTARLLEPGASSFLFASGLLLATGSTYDPETGETSSIGLAAFTPDGEERFRLFQGESAWVVQVYGGRAYVDAPRGGAATQPLRVVDLRQGRLVGARPKPLPWLVTAPASGWWG
jgi:hypothetical protein